jgi:hypothetical protein
VRKLRITYALLADLKACNDAIHAFDCAYPRGVVITDDQRVNFPIIAALVDAVDGDMLIAGTLNSICDVAWLVRALSGDHQGDGARVWVPFCPCDTCDLEGVLSDPFRLAGLLADAVGVYLTAERKD